MSYQPDYLAMYIDALKRYGSLTDAVFRFLAEKDVVGLLNFTGDLANAVDHVDDELIAVSERAFEAWGERTSPEPAT